MKKNRNYYLLFSIYFYNRQFCLCQYRDIAKYASGGCSNRFGAYGKSSTCYGGINGKDPL